MTPKFGYCLPIFASPGERLFRTPNYAQLDTATTMQLGQLADTLGFDSLWVADHLMLGSDDAILEGWTVLAALAGSTKQAALGLIHQAHPLRHPALAAKMAATLDQISGGRFIYFLDCGRSADEYLAYGIPWNEDKESRIKQMVEGLELSLALWTADAALSFTGDFYQLDKAVCRPAPWQKPHPPVWLGEAEESIMAACAHFAQGWNSVAVPIPELTRRLSALEKACEKINRAYSDIEKSLELQVLITADVSSLRVTLANMVALFPEGQTSSHELKDFLAGATDQLPAEMKETWLIGTPEEVKQQLQIYVELGISHFMLWFADAPDATGMKLFASEVIPQYGIQAE